jgi:hypothetical protein
MYKCNVNKNIDFQYEKEAIIEHCNKYWDISDNSKKFIKLVDFLFCYGQKMGQNQFNFDSFFNFLSDSVSEEIIKSSKYSDDSIKLVMYHKKFDISMLNMNIVDFFCKEFRYEDSIPKLLKFVKNEFKEFKTIKPINWKKYLKSSEDFDQDDHVIENGFQGFDCSRIYPRINYSFPESLFLDNIKSNNDYNIKPLESLITAIVYQGFTAQVHNNTVEMLKEFNTLFDNKNQSFEFDKILSQTKNNIFKALLECTTFDKNDKASKKEFQKPILSRLLFPFPIPEEVFNEQNNKETINKNILNIRNSVKDIALNKKTFNK